MITELFIEGNKLDLTADISSLLTFAIDDVKDFSSRQTAFSKTVILPGTAKNNRIFGNIFATGISNDYDPLYPNIGYNFNPAISAKCLMFQDNLQTFKGTLRLLTVTKNKHTIEYEAALNGELTSLNVQLSGSLLTDLDFHEYNQLWNKENIVASWDAEPGSGVYFPLIDYGTYSFNKHDWDFRTFRPALFVKEYIDKMFAAADFRYTCDLFNTDRFKRLVVPHNQKQLTKRTGAVVSASHSGGPFHILNHVTGLFDNDAPFDTHVGALFTYTDTLVEPATGRSIRKFTYNATDTIATTLEIHVGGWYNFAFGAGLTLTISILKNGSVYYTDPSPNNANIARDVHFAYDYSLPVTLSTGDYLEVHYALGGSLAGGAVGDVYADEQTFAMTSTSIITAPLDYNEEIDLFYALPQNIRQVDFLVSIVKLFNLYVYESPFDDRLIYIKPFVDFYSSASGNAIDWTYKLNRDVPIKIQPLSEINSKIYQFNFRDDSDYYNELYKKRYNQGYGSHIYDTQFEFASQTNTLELIFAPTPIVGYLGEDKVYPTIFKRTGTTTIVEETIDSVIRIMQTKKITSVGNWNIMNGETALAAYNVYGYAGHYDNPRLPSNDLNFGALKEVLFTLPGGDLSKTQFNVYWSAYMAEITDKDSKLVTAKFYLTAADIFKLDFSKYIYFDGAIFRLNKISDYNASMPSDCTVELLKVINTSYSFPPFNEPGASGGYWIDADGAFVIDFDNAKILYI